MQINDIVHGFRLVRREEVKETASTAYEFHHEKSGARLLYLQNKDDNKVFSISFRTPPEDDTGVPHIIEHSTLCGSRKFPLKEPFVELVKGSLNTFLNAMTYPDKTMYPVASCNDKDFHNLMDVYLDAVFYPAIYNQPEILMQEGWHYEIEKPEEPLRYSGVVYNEMKGALSSPEDLLEIQVMKALFPDNTYACESGGNPAAIPNLTYEQFIDFHKKYYAPSNSYIYLYGDMDIEEKLAFINDEYLSHFDVVQVDSHIPLQESFGHLKEIQATYPIGEEESTEGKTFLSYNLVMAKAGEHELVNALQLLEQALLKTPAAPLRKALIDAGIGMDVSSHLETNVHQPYLTITVNGAEADKVELFKEVIHNTLTDLAEKGIDRDSLEAALNLFEFQLREADFGSYPKGLIYNISLMTNWLYDQDPLTKLRYEQDIVDLREKLAGNYYEELLKKYFLDNTFGAVVIMAPDKEMAQKQEQAMAEKLADIKAKMSTEELQQIIENTAKLKLRQQTPDSPEALSTIPLLKIEDIEPNAKKIPLEEKELKDIKVLYTPADTNGIVYLNLYFKADVIPQELIPYAYIYCDILGLVDTENTSYEDMTNRVNLNTGGISFDIVNFTQSGKADSMAPYFKVTAKAFARKVPELADILAEILLTTKYDDKKRILELLQQDRSEMELNMLQSSVQVALARLNSFISKSGAYNEIGELSLYPVVKKLTDEFEENVENFCSKLQQVGELLFNSQNLVMGVTIEEGLYNKFAQEIAPLLEALAEASANKSVQMQDYVLPVENQQEALMSSSQVQYVAKGANLYKLGYEMTGAYQVLDMLLRYEYFWVKIRVQGGAYGAMTRFNLDGDMMFVSYRDPNLAETIKVFDETADFLRGFEASDREMTKYIIGTMSGVDTPMTPRLLGNNAQRLYFRGITYEERQKRRQQLLHTTVEDIRNLAPAIEACMEENNLCVFGNAGVIKANEGLFQKLTPVMD